MKSNSYLAVESLFHISENLLRQTGRVGYYRPYFSTFRWITTPGTAAPMFTPAPSDRRRR